MQLASRSHARDCAQRRRSEADLALSVRHGCYLSVCGCVERSWIKAEREGRKSGRCGGGFCSEVDRASTCAPSSMWGRALTRPYSNSVHVTFRHVSRGSLCRACPYSIATILNDCNGQMYSVCLAILRLPCHSPSLSAHFMARGFDFGSTATTTALEWAKKGEGRTEEQGEEVRWAGGEERLERFKGGREGEGGDSMRRGCGFLGTTGRSEAFRSTVKAGKTGGQRCDLAQLSQMRRISKYLAVDNGRARLCRNNRERAGRVSK